MVGDSRAADSAQTVNGHDKSFRFHREFSERRFSVPMFVRLYGDECGPERCARIIERIRRSGWFEEGEIIEIASV